MTRPSAPPELAVPIPALSERENLKLPLPALREVPPGQGGGGGGPHQVPRVSPGRAAGLRIRRQHQDVQPAHERRPRRYRLEGDPPVAAAIRRLIEDASLRLRLGQAGAARVKQEFSVERYVGRLLDVYATAKSPCG